MKRRHYPGSLKVGNKSYALLFLPHLEATADEETRGYCEVKDKFIAIKDSLGERETFSTLVHELLHAAEKEHGLKLRHKDVYALEKALSQILLDNFHMLPRR